MSDGEKYYASGGGLGLFGALTVLFVALRLTDTIDWPWVWVLAPLWISVSLWAVVCFIVALLITWRSW